MSILFAAHPWKTRLVVAARSFLLDWCLGFSRSTFHVSSYLPFFASVWSTRVLLFVLPKKHAKPQRDRRHDNTGTIPHTTVEIFLLFVNYEASSVSLVGYGGSTGPWPRGGRVAVVVVFLLTPVFGAVVTACRQVGATKIGCATGMVFVLCLLMHQNRW